ncbi:DUF1345 domain-containing protein [Rhizobium sp.]
MHAETAPAPIRHILIRIRLFGSCALGILTFLLTPSTLDASSRFLIGWNVAITVFIVLVAIMWARSTHETMRLRAKALDEGRRTVLVLAMAAALCSLVAIVVELFNLKQATDTVIALHIGLSLSTIVTAWTFVHIIFTEHYAHGFYLEKDGDEAKAENKNPERRGLRFPGQTMPDYVDFLYFSFTVGVANQTADVEIVSRGMRRLVLIHSVISYFFNTIILALTINIAASMIGG